MTYTWAGNAASGNAYRVRPIGALGGGVPNFAPANPRPRRARPSAGSLRVVGMNLLNFFNTFGVTLHRRRRRRGHGLPRRRRRGRVRPPVAEDRRRDHRHRRRRDRRSTRSRTTATAPPAPSSSSSTGSTRRPLPGTYAFIDADAGTGQINALGTDAIKVGFLYKPASVTPIGTTAALNTVAFVNGGDGAPRNRPSLAQAFEENATGGRVRRQRQPPQEQGQRLRRARRRRRPGQLQRRAHERREPARRLAARRSDRHRRPDVLMLGDLNAYAKEDPIAAIEAKGFTNLIAAEIGAEAYSYVFDGQWGYLDHALGTTPSSRRSPASPSGTSTPTSRACSTTTTTSSRRAAGLASTPRISSASPTTTR